jgi:hypothetical protein
VGEAVEAGEEEGVRRLNIAPPPPPAAGELPNPLPVACRSGLDDLEGPELERSRSFSLPALERSAKPASPALFSFKDLRDGAAGAEAGRGGSELEALRAAEPPLLTPKLVANRLGVPSKLMVVSLRAVVPVAERLAEGAAASPSDSCTDRSRSVKR